MSFWLGIAVLLAILACVGVATFLTGGSAVFRPNIAKIGARAPEISLRLLQDGKPGRPVTLSELEGKPVVLNFWATWCNPCRQEFPALQAHYEKHKDEGLVLVGIDSQGDVGAAGAASFVRQMSATFPIWLDENGSAEESYRVDSLPTTVFIDRHGIIQDVVVGGPMTVEYLEKELKKIL